MQILASKFIYSKDKGNLKEVLLPFKDLPIQLAFFQRRDFSEAEHDLIKEICKSLNIEIPTVHAPIIDVFDPDFLKVIESIKKIYQIKIISIHPQRGEIESALAKLREYSSIIESLNLILAYENFGSSVAKRKWINSPYQMYLKFDLPFLKITFDTSHLDSPSDCIEEFDRVSDKVETIHLSDRTLKRQHLPLGEGLLPYKEFLNHLKEKEFGGFLVLEYLDEFQDRLIEDLKRVSSFLL